MGNHTLYSQTLQKRSTQEKLSSTAHTVPGHKVCLLVISPLLIMKLYQCNLNANTGKKKTLSKELVCVGIKRCAERTAYYR